MKFPGGITAAMTILSLVAALNLSDVVLRILTTTAQEKREEMLMKFWQSILNARTQLVFGDFNKRAYLNKNDETDRPNNTMKQFLEDAISTCGVKVEFSMFRADAGKYPENKSWLVMLKTIPCYSSCWTIRTWPSRLRSNIYVSQHQQHNWTTKVCA